MEAIQFIGLKELSPEEQRVVQNLSTEYYDKVQREAKKVTALVIHIKQHEKGGSKKKYSVHIRVDAPTFLFESTKANDWDLAKTMHKAFEDVMHGIQHRLHTEKGYKKSYE